MTDIKELVEQLGGDEQQVYKAHKTLLEMVTRATAPGKASDRQELATALVEELSARKSGPKDANGKKKKDEGPLHPVSVRSQIARLLSFVASDKEIPALSDAIRDLDVRESARYSLDFNTSDAATQALVKALDDVGPEFREGVAGALGRRRGSAVLEALQNAAANDTDPDVQIVAVEELSHFPEAKNDSIMLEAAKGPYRSRVVAARIRLAETLRQAGLRPEARRIYQSVQSGDAESYQKRAAQIALDSM